MRGIDSINFSFFPTTTSYNYRYKKLLCASVSMNNSNSLSPNHNSLNDVMNLPNDTDHNFNNGVIGQKRSASTHHSSSSSPSSLENPREKSFLLCKSYSFI